MARKVFLSLGNGQKAAAKVSRWFLDDSRCSEPCTCLALGRRVPRGDDAESDVHSVRGDYACPNQEGGARGSGDKPVPSAQAEAAPDEPEDEDDATDVSISESSAGVPTDVPSDHYLKRIPKHPKCEACQSAKVQNRHCRKKGKDIAHSDRHKADKFGDWYTADTSFSYDGLSVDGDVI